MLLPRGVAVYAAGASPRPTMLAFALAGRIVIELLYDCHWQSCQFGFAARSTTPLWEEFTSDYLIQFVEKLTAAPIARRCRCVFSWRRERAPALPLRYLRWRAIRSRIMCRFCLFFNGHQLVDPALMPLVVGKFRTQPGVHDFQRQHLTDHAGAHGHHVGVVVFPGQPGAHDIGQ